MDFGVYLTVRKFLQWICIGIANYFSAYRVFNGAAYRNPSNIFENLTQSMKDNRGCKN